MKLENIKLHLLLFDSVLVSDTAESVGALEICKLPKALHRKTFSAMPFFRDVFDFKHSIMTAYNVFRVVKNPFFSKSYA